MHIKGGARVIYQKKTPSGYTAEWDNEGEKVWEDLAKDLIAKKLEGCKYSGASEDVRTTMERIP